MVIDDPLLSTGLLGEGLSQKVSSLELDLDILPDPHHAFDDEVETSFSIQRRRSVSLSLRRDVVKHWDGLPMKKFK